MSNKTQGEIRRIQKDRRAEKLLRDGKLIKTEEKEPGEDFFDCFMVSTLTH